MRTRKSYWDPSTGTISKYHLTMIKRLQRTGYKVKDFGQEKKKAGIGLSCLAQMLKSARIPNPKVWKINFKSDVSPNRGCIAIEHISVKEPYKPGWPLTTKADVYVIFWRDNHWAFIINIKRLRNNWKELVAKFPPAGIKQKTCRDGKEWNSDYRLVDISWLKEKHTITASVNLLAEEKLHHELAQNASTQ